MKRALHTLVLLGAAATAAALAGCPDLGDTNMDWSRLDRPEPPPRLDSGPTDAGDGGDGGQDLDAGDPAPSHVDILVVNLAFDPLHARVAAGGSVTWYNLDAVQHDIRSGSPEVPNATFNSGLLDRGDSFTFDFPAPALDEYYCSTHSKQMRGATVEVVEPGR